MTSATKSEKMKGVHRHRSIVRPDNLRPDPPSPRRRRQGPRASMGRPRLRSVLAAAALLAALPPSAAAMAPAAPPPRAPRPPPGRRSALARLVADLSGLAAAGTGALALGAEAASPPPQPQPQPQPQRPRRTGGQRCTWPGPRDPPGPGPRPSPTEAAGRRAPPSNASFPRPGW